MKNIIFIVLVCFCLTGCSLLPKLSFTSGNNVPQSTEQSRRIVKCSGELVLNEDGTVASCTSGFYSDEQNYSKQERRQTFFEKIGQFFANLKGFFGILIIGSIILIFMGLGGIVTSFWQAVFGVGSRAIKSTVQAIKNAKERIKANPNDSNAFLDELAKAHSEDKEVQEYVNKIRAEIASK